MLPATANFLVVDDNPDTRFVVVRTLTKSFPNCVVHECDAADSGLDRGRDPGLSAVIVHRTTEMTGVYFIQSLRQINPRVPVLMISGIDRTHAATAAGATQFLLFDDWKQLGAVVTRMLATASAAGS
jgi:DNA-binding NtrC family response regulator